MVGIPTFIIDWLVTPFIINTDPSSISAERNGTVEINADSLDTAKEWAMDLLKRQIVDYQGEASFGSDAHHNPFEFYDLEILQANEAG